MFLQTGNWSLSKQFGAKPLLEPILAYCQLHSRGLISVKFESEFCHFHPRNCIWHCSLPLWRPFCSGEMSYDLTWKNPHVCCNKILARTEVISIDKLYDFGQDCGFLSALAMEILQSCEKDWLIDFVDLIWFGLVFIWFDLIWFELLVDWMFDHWFVVTMQHKGTKRTWCSWKATKRQN